MITLELFDQQLRATWDDIVSKARNGLFQFQRNYLEYHKLRFTDASVLFRKGANPIGCLPMSRHEDTLISHGGLTFGGILTLPEARLTHVRDMLRLAKDFAKQSNCRKILYKSIPRIYHRNPSDEDLYCLFLEGGRLVRRDLNTVLEYGRSARVHARRSRGAAKSKRSGIVVEIDSSQFPAFWNVLGENLSKRHNTGATHSLDEILLLKSRFSNEIKLHVAMLEGSVIAGVVTYETELVAHAQYISSTAEGRRLHALDQLLLDVLENFKNRCRFFSFGISTTNEGREVNEGLVDQKEGFGGRTITHDFYEIDV